MWIVNFQMFKLDLEKVEEPDIKLPTSVRSWKMQQNSRKTPTSASFDYAKDCGLQQNCGKFLKRWEYQTSRPASWEICIQVKKQQNWTWNNRLVTNWKGVNQGCILSPCLFNLYAECTLCEMLGWTKHKLKSRLQGKISVITDMQMTPPLWHKAKRN